MHLVLFFMGIFLKLRKKINATDCVLLFFAYICFDYKLLLASNVKVKVNIKVTQKQTN